MLTRLKDKGLLQSLRFRMVFAASTVLVVMLALLVANSVRLMDNTLAARENERLRELQVLLNAALATPLVQGDHTALDALLKQLHREKALVYLVLVDANQRVVASEGWERNRPLPPRSADFSELPPGATRFDGVVPIHSDGRAYGQLYFGVDTGFMHNAGSALLWQSVAIGWLAFVLTIILLSIVAFWLTRNLRSLQRGVAALESGESPIKLPVPGNDEIGALTRAFNRMAQTLDERVEALKKSEARFHAIADYTFGVEAWFNPQGRLIWVNRSVERVTGYTPLECLLARNLIETLVFEKDRRHAQEVALKAVRGSTGENFEVRLRRKDGEVAWISVNWQPIHGPGNEYLGLRVSADEIQSRKEAELKLLDTVVELRRAQALKEYYLNHSNDERLRLEALLNVMKVGVLFVDASHRVLYCNRPFREMWGYGPDENLTGTRDVILVERSAAVCADEAPYREHLAEVLSRREPSQPFEIALKDGRTIAQISALIAGATPGKFIGRVWIYEDVSEQKRTAEKLIQLAERDPLTNLFNRRRFQEELERVIADAARRGVQAGLLALDLDGFKPINDEFGHQSGDVVLVALANEVAAIVRRNEMFFRIGGDEFAVLVPDTSEEQMIGLARRVGARIAELRFDFPGREARLTASLGIAMYPKHATSGEEMIARADHAMYQAKMSGKNCWTIYPGIPVPH